MIDDFRPMRPTKPAPTKPTSPTAETSKPASTAPFQTPDQVSQHDQEFVQTTSNKSPAASGRGSQPPHRANRNHWFHLSWPPNRTQIMLIVGVFIIVLAGTASFITLHQTDANPIVASTPKPKKVAPKPTVVPSTLTGLDVAPEVNQRPVIGAMIENSPDARPQSGLSQAGVVFEAVAEGGVTRFLALFQDQQPTNIGPVRSARPYYIQWLQGFHAAYAHVGGSPDALADVKSWGVQDLDQFANSGAYHRVNSRRAPHNMYASVVDLAALATKKGYSSPFQGFVRKKPAPAKQPTATSIAMSLSSSAYNVQYAYNATTNSYSRSEGGAAQVDANTGSQITPSVVIALVVPLSAGSRDAQGSAYSNYNPIGDGVAYVFQDGTVTVGSWHKADNATQLSFTDANGAALGLNPGQTWITAVSASSKVNYQ